MHDTNDINLIRDVLESAGLVVNRIPESNKPRCDLSARDESAQYLIEVKSLNDDENIRKSLRVSEAHTGERQHFYANSVRTAIDYAVKQLQATQNDLDDSLLFVALIAKTQFGRDVTESQILGTLYGTRCILHSGDDDRLTSTECLYFSHSAFHLHPELAGAIVSDGSNMTVCLNDFCPEISRVRQSTLARFFARRGALNDATNLERDGNFFVADCKLDRGDEDRVLQFVIDKYNLPTGSIVAHPTEYSATTFVPNQA